MSSNPLRDNLRIEPTPGPSTLVIFGASGDLTRRKLLPAIYQLSRTRRLPARFSVIGVARSAYTDAEFRQQFRDSLREFTGVDAARDQVARSLEARLSYIAGELDDRALYQELAKRLDDAGPGGVLFYLAIPPSVYGVVAERLGEAGLSKAQADGWRRLIVEKPFGTDLASARALNGVLHSHFDEEQIFRIDHYLGKETVQNLLVFPRPRRWASSAGPRTTRGRARCGTWCRIT
jgi:glucose-6-phosphate 1-dehydrogenase